MKSQHVTSQQLASPASPAESLVSLITSNRLTLYRIRVLAKLANASSWPYTRLNSVYIAPNVRMQ